jgi:drug/metabolite transporter (DMT)-like permease
MPLQSILLLGLAAVVHSAWNLLSKRSLDKQVFLWLALVGSLVIFLLPVSYVYVRVPPTIWGIILLSGLLEAMYFLLLGSAYQRGDLSLVYPLARGSAPLFVTLFALAFLGERVSPQGVSGILLIVGGIYTLHLKSLDWRGLLVPLLALRRERASQLALLVGMTIASYSVVDKVGVRYVSPFQYLYLVFVVSGVALAPYMLAARRDAIRREWGANKAAIVAVAIMYVGSFLLVLIALTSSQVSYVSSVREVSVVFGAALGAFILREPFGGTKILGAAFIFAGIVCIGLAA